MPCSDRSEEHTSELQSLRHLVCRLLLEDRKSTRLNSSHLGISYAVFCLKKKIAHLLSARTPERLQSRHFGISSRLVARRTPRSTSLPDTTRACSRACVQIKFFFLMIRRPPRSTLLPYTPLFR